MKIFESKFGAPLTREQMKKIVGGVKQYVDCHFFNYDGSTDIVPCAYDPDLPWGPYTSVADCQSQYDAFCGTVDGCQNVCCGDINNCIA